MTSDNLQKSISVVVPVYNSQNTLDPLIKKLQKTLSGFKEYQIILVNDHSADNSFEIIKQHGNSDTNVIGIDLMENVGQQLSTFLGLKYAKGDYIVTVDDDLAHSPDDILLLCTEMQKGCDAIYGIDSANARSSIHRNLGSKIRDFTFRHLTAIPKNVTVSSFRIINRNTKDKVITANTKFIYISMEILKHTTNICSIPVSYTAGSPSNYKLSKLTALIRNIYLYYSGQKTFKLRGLSNDVFKIGEIINGDKI